MDKLIIFDANGVAWIIEDRPEKNNGGPHTVWAHVRGDDEVDSGYTGMSIFTVIKDLNDDGYMDEDEEDDGEGTEFSYISGKW